MIQELVNNKISLDVFPNPAREFVYVDVNELAGLSGAIEVYNVLGQQLSNQYFEELPYGATQLNIKGWAKGVYTLSVQLENGKSTSKQFIVD